MLHACVKRFDVIDERGNILGWEREVNKAQLLPKFYYAKRRFPITSKCRHMYEVLNIDEI
jgi:hypothetical protein